MKAKKAREYDVAFEGIAILRVKANSSENAIRIAFRDIFTGDFEIRDYDVSPVEESKKA